MVIADHLKRDKDCLKVIDQQVEAKWENQRAFLASFVNLLTCNQRAERGEDQAHNLFLRVGEHKRGGILSSESSIPWCNINRKRVDAVEYLELSESHETTEPEDTAHFLVLNNNDSSLCLKIMRRSQMRQVLHSRRFALFGLYSYLPCSLPY